MDRDQFSILVGLFFVFVLFLSIVIIETTFKF